MVSMEQRQLGQSGLSLPVVGMGTWKTFDVQDPAAVAARRKVVDVALEHGSNLFDSSPMYGAAERVLSAGLSGRRDQALVATKVWTPDDDEAAAQIQRALDYYAGRVDIYQVHNLVAWPTRLATLERLRDKQQVRAVGITHHEHPAFDELMNVMRTGRVTCIQVPYNLHDRLVEQAVLPLAAELGIGVLVMRPLQQGTLATRQPSAEQLEPLRAFGVSTWSQALLKWILSDTRVTAIIPATSSPAHAADNASAGSPPWFGAEERAYVARLAEQA
jgi:aryl-alcohol dehydrogenase-like predicted oxidoreductase